MVTSERSAKSMTFAVTQPGLRCHRRFGDFNTISVGGFSQQYWMLQCSRMLQVSAGSALDWKARRSGRPLLTLQGSNGAPAEIARAFVGLTRFMTASQRLSTK